MEQTGGGWDENIFDLIKENDIESIRSMVETFGKGMDDEGMDDEGIYDEGMDDEGMDDEFNKINGEGERPLHVAITMGNLEICQLLIDGGADVNMENNSNQSPLMIALEADEVNIDLIKLLIDTGADINFKDSEGDSPLIVASEQHQDLELMRVFLNTPNINVNIVDRRGRTALHEAVILSNIDMCKLLIEYGADVNIQDNDGDTPLLKAFKVNEFNLEIVRLLVDRGAYININDNNNRNVFFYADDNEELINILKNGRIKDLYQKRYSFVPRNFTKGKPRQGGSKRRKSKRSKRSKKSKRSKRSKKSKRSRKSKRK